jgi:NAD(P)-dependent dehydrogenase (short-subunit alcohol dehydrogenase family)
MKFEQGRQIALVVGGSSGVGLEIAKALSHDFLVIIISRRRPNVCDELPGKFFHEYCDVENTESIKEVIEKIVSLRGKIDVLIYSAGYQSLGSLRNISAIEIKKHFQVNLFGAIEFCKIVSSKKFSNSTLAMCLVSSISAQKPEPGILPYAISKAALEAMVRGFAVEIAPRRIFCVSPGWMDTEMTKNNELLYTKDFVEKMQKKSPCGLIEIESVVNLVQFLISSRAKHITGQTYIVDGGMSLV